MALKIVNSIPKSGAFSLERFAPSFSEDDFKYAENAFARNFQSFSGNFGDQELIAFDVLSTLFGSDPQSSSMLTIYYGFNVQANKMVYGVSATTADVTISDSKTTYSFETASIPEKVIENGNLVPISEIDWTVMANNYYSNIQVRDRMESFRPLNSDEDAGRVTIPWKNDIWKMYQETAAGANQPTLALESVSMFHSNRDGGTSGLRHGVALFVKAVVDGELVALMDNEDLVSIYHFAAADFGSLCPPPKTCGPKKLVRYH